MADLADGSSLEIQGSGSTTYTIKNVGGAYSCTCPAWRFQPAPPEKRTCKHIRTLRGSAAEEERLGQVVVEDRRRPAVVSAPGQPAGASEAPKLLLAHRWQGDIDIAGWWMSEKLDGVRALWNGRELISRLGNAYLAPPWFTAQFPSMVLDGELFGGRGEFQRTVSVVRRQDRSDDWKRVRYVVFDAPELPGPFEERCGALREVLEACRSPYVSFHPHERCDDEAHLGRELARVETLGGEGLMLRQPGSPYQVGRSFTLLKVKSFFDSEARVVDHLEGTGKHMGRLGALMVELRSGKRFKVGTGFTDDQRGSPPPVGSLITFRYQELTDGGVPRFPSFLGERHDLAWDMVEAPRRASPIQPGQSVRRRLPVPPPGPAPVVLPSPPTLPSAPGREEPPPEVDASGNVYLEFQRGSTVKFWEVEWEGTAVSIEYGRVDHGPKREIQEFPDSLAARRFVERQIRGKREKGYVDEL